MNTKTLINQLAQEKNSTIEWRTKKGNPLLEIKKKSLAANCGG
jgi:hypothetical protein